RAPSCGRVRRGREKLAGVCPPLTLGRGHRRGRRIPALLAVVGERKVLEKSLALRLGDPQPEPGERFLGLIPVLAPDLLRLGHDPLPDPVAPRLGLPPGLLLPLPLLGLPPGPLLRDPPLALGFALVLRQRIQVAVLPGPLDLARCGERLGEVPLQRESVPGLAARVGVDPGHAADRPPHGVLAVVTDQPLEDRRLLAVHRPRNDLAGEPLLDDQRHELMRRGIRRRALLALLFLLLLLSGPD